MSKYWKAIVAVVGAGAIAVQSALTDSTITQAEWVAIGIAVITAIGVYSKANTP